LGKCASLLWKRRVQRVVCKRLGVSINAHERYSPSGRHQRKKREVQLTDADLIKWGGKK